MDVKQQVEETRLKVEKEPEASNFLAKIAEYPLQEQEHALAFLRGIQFAQSIRPAQ